jgi:glycosyltransferase involved in cell wall biosynthesis
LFFGVVAPYKGLDLLMDAVEQIDGVDDFRLIVAGRCRDPALRERLREWVRVPRAHARVVWLDEFIPDEVVPGLFHACDVTVMPYRAIYQSGVVFMAIATGCPVVATEVGSLPEDVPATGGMVVPPGDSVALAQAIERVALSSRNGRRVANEADRYLWANTVRPILHLYRKQRQKSVSM